MNTLFLSASTGGGHDKAAEAIIECIKQKNPDSGIIFSDSLKNISPALNKIITGTYLYTIRNTPKVYGSLYKLSEATESITDITKTINRLFSYKLSDFINAAAPSLIVSTHTFPLQMVSNLKKKGKLSVPAIGIVTDYTNHSFWKLDNIDAFIVAHEYVKEDMIKMGISDSKIFTYGIPVCRSFLQKKDKKALLSELGLQDKATVLIMGGSLGLGEIKNVFSSLLECNRDLQIIAVTGLNSKLEKQLKSLTAGSNKAVRIFSFTNKISDLMDICDMIITKPGGVTVAEALVKQIPIIIMSPLPGQEEKNARFLMNYGAAVRLFSGDDIDNILHQILDNPLKIRQMKEMSAFLARPDAAEKTASLLQEMSKEMVCDQKVPGISLCSTLSTIS